MGDRIRVLSVSTYDSAGGAARAAYRIHLAVLACGVDSRMFVQVKKRSDERILRARDFVPRTWLYRLFNWPRKKLKKEWQAYQWGKYPDKGPDLMSDLIASDIGGALKKIDYDVLHLHWANNGFLPLDKLPRNKPIVWTLHDTWPFCGVCHYFYECRGFMKECGQCPQLGSASALDLSRQVWKRKRRIYRKLDLHVVSPSRWLGENARKSSLFGDFPMTVIPNCLDTGRFRPMQEKEISPRWRRLQEGSGKPYILYGAMFASTDRRKGFHLLLSALEILVAAGKGDMFELIVFGANKPLEGVPEAIPVHNVGFVGDTDELASLYNLAQVMVVPSLSENLACTIMESMSCGTPVTAFGIGGNGDLVYHQVNGYLARESDVEDLARGILWCLEHARTLGEAARRKVLQNYTPEIIGEKYSDLYRSLLPSSDR